MWLCKDFTHITDIAGASSYIVKALADTSDLVAEWQGWVSIGEYGAPWITLTLCVVCVCVCVCGERKETYIEYVTPSFL